MIFIVWPIVRVFYYLYNARKFARQQQEAFRKAYSRATEGSGSNYEPDSRQNQSRKKKVFSKTDGEYVDFEEISCETTTIGTETSATSDTYIREDQVSDAEWTEIK